MTPENNNPVKSFRFNGHEIDVDKMTTADDLEFEVEKNYNFENAKFKDFTSCINVNTDMSKADFKKLLRSLKSKIPRKIKKKKYGTKRGHRRFELKLRDNRTFSYTDFHFLGFIKATHEIQKMYYDKIGKKLFYIENQEYKFNQLEMILPEKDEIKPKFSYYEPKFSYYEPKVNFAPEL